MVRKVYKLFIGSPKYIEIVKRKKKRLERADTDKGKILV